MTGEQICKMVSHGNADALRFCLAWHEFAHLIDDCADKDKPVDDNRLARISVNYTLELCGNPFFQTHKAQLVSLMVVGFNSWVDSNRMNNGEECPAWKRRQMNAQRDVLKGHYHEVLYYVAMITGGWEALRALTSEVREYDFEEDTL